MTQQQPYEVVTVHSGFELRRYPAHLIAEIEVNGTFERAGNEAFGPLVGYIRGANHTRHTIGMTAPVVQSVTGPPSIPMTAPISQQDGIRAGTFRVWFVLPATLSKEAAPVPDDPRVRITSVPEQLAAASRFSGRWTQATYQHRTAALLKAVDDAGLRPAGPIRYARFDPPWTPWFLRRNEVVLPISTPITRTVEHERPPQ